jgi:hypothetical protein
MDQWASCVGEVRETVEWYFGELLDSVASQTPVTRGGLLDALTSLHLAALDRRAVLLERGTVVWWSETETVHALPECVWTTLADAGDVTDPHERAAREVHRQMGIALATADDERLPFVLVSSAC